MPGAVISFGITCVIQVPMFPDVSVIEITISIGPEAIDPATGDWLKESIPASVQYSTAVYAALRSGVA
jgi:hypothetical protein